MRHVWLVALVLVPLALLTVRVEGQENKKPIGRPMVFGKIMSFAEIHKILQMPMSMQDFQQPTTLKEFIGVLIEKLHAEGKDFPIVVNGEAFREKHPDDFPENSSVYENTQVKFPAWYKPMPVAKLLESAVAQIPKGVGTFLIRAGQVEILPKARTAKEFLLNQTFVADLRQLPLYEALDYVGEVTGVTVILDVRAKDKEKLPVSAQFRNDVAVQDAVRMLAEMADLKLVHLPTGLFVTTAEQAQKFRQELKAIYEAPPAAPPRTGCVSGPGAGPSPLAPPAAPPLRGQEPKP